MVKNVEIGYRDCTVELNGTECEVVFSNEYRVFSVENNGSGDVIVAIESGKTADDDGVRVISAGCSGMLAHMRTGVKSVFITGSGKVAVNASNEVVNPFKQGGKGGEPSPELEYEANPRVTADTWQGVVTASGDNGYGWSPWKAFDGAADTGSSRWVGNKGNDSWIAYDFKEPRYLGYLMFNPTKESRGDLYPMIVSGSNDGIVFEKLIETAVQTTKADDFIRVDINSTKTYKMYKVTVYAAGEIVLYTAAKPKPKEDTYSKAEIDSMLNNVTPQLLFSGVTNADSPAVVDLSRYDMVEIHSNIKMNGYGYFTSPRFSKSDLEYLNANIPISISIGSASAMVHYCEKKDDNTFNFYVTTSSGGAVNETKIYGINQHTELKIFSQPQDVTCAVGDTATFHVGVQGDGLSYQWQVLTRSTASWTDLTGASAKTSSANVAGDMSYNGWKFRCVITDKYGNTVTSDVATLTVTS